MKPPKKRKKEAAISLIFADFKNGTYEVAGQASSLSAIFEENTDWQDYNAGMVVSGVGLTVSGTNNMAGPKVVDALAADFLTNGVTIVAQINLFAEGASPSGFQAEMLDLPDWNAEFLVYIQSLAGSYVSTPEELTGAGPAGAGAHKVAVTVAPDGVSMSINGQDTISAPYTGTFAPNALAFAIQRGAIEDLTFVAPVAAADLPALSAL